jgi:hypothetical protein
MFSGMAVTVVVVVAIMILIMTALIESMLDVAVKC